MTGLPSDTSISLTDDAHNWCRKIPVCMAYAEQFKLGKTKQWSDLELKARQIFYAAELGPEDIWLENLRPLGQIWNQVRPSIEFLMAKKQFTSDEQMENAAEELHAALLNNIDDLDLE